MSALKIAAHVGMAVVTALAVVSAVQSVRTYRKAKATTVSMKKANDAFEQTILNNLFEMGGQELVDDYKRRTAKGGV